MTTFQIRPNVIGEWGEEMDFDASREPRLVGPFHYAVDSWSGEDLVSTHPFYFVTRRLADAITAAGLSGVRFAPAKVTASEQAIEIGEETALPDLVQLEVVGDESSDFHLHRGVYLRVSERAMDLLRGFELGIARVHEVTE